MELLDYADTVGCHITLSGILNRFVNANLVREGEGSAIIEGRSAYGRSDVADLDDALEDLAAQISGKIITFDSNRQQTFNVPKLAHSKGYRG